MIPSLFTPMIIIKDAHYKVKGISEIYPYVLYLGEDKNVEKGKILIINVHGPKAEGSKLILYQNEIRLILENKKFLKDSPIESVKAWIQNKLINVHKNLEDEKYILMGIKRERSRVYMAINAENLYLDIGNKTMDLMNCEL